MFKNISKLHIFYAILMSSIVILANYSVQFNIANSPLTYGALTYPFSFLLLDILSERYGKEFAIKTLRLGIVLALIPSIFIATPRIAIASILAFSISQHIAVYSFFVIKNITPRLWWLRNNGSELLAQFGDKMIFFFIAFLGIYSFGEVLSMALSDYVFSVILSIINTPLFYAFAMRYKNKNIRNQNDKSNI